MFKVENLNVSYNGNPVLKNINFSIFTDDILTIIGPSGVGKTTLIKAISQLIPYQGNIKLNDRKIDLKKETIALVPQDYGLLPWKTVEQNIYLAKRIRQHKRLSKEQKNRIFKN